jgi:hypothetical protein
MTNTSLQRFLVYMTECARLLYWAYFKPFTLQHWLTEIHPKLNIGTNPFQERHRFASSPKLRRYAEQVTLLNLIIPLLVIIMFAIPFTLISDMPFKWAPPMFFFVGWSIGILIATILPVNILHRIHQAIMTVIVIMFVIVSISDEQNWNWPINIFYFGGQVIYTLIFGVVTGVIFGIRLSMLSVLYSTIVGLFGMTFGMGFGELENIAYNMEVNVVINTMKNTMNNILFWFMIGLGVMFGIILSVLYSGLFLTFDNKVGSVVLGVLTSVMFGMITSMVMFVSNSAVFFNLMVGIVFAIVCFLGIFRVYFWLPELLWATALAWLSPCPVKALRFLPPYFDQLTMLPLPFMDRLIIRAYHDEPLAAQQTIYYMINYTNQVNAVAKVTAEILTDTIFYGKTIQDISILSELFPLDSIPHSLTKKVDEEQLIIEYLKISQVVHNALNATPIELQQEQFKKSLTMLHNLSQEMPDYAIFAKRWLFILEQERHKKE